MNNIRFSFAIIALLATVYFGYSYVNTDEPWTSKEIIQPNSLMNILKNKSTEQPLIFNIGFAGNITQAKEIGAANEQEGLNKLKTNLKNIAKNKFIVFYCGCCPYSHCPNIRPAFKVFKDLGFTNFKLLDLPENLKVNWINKGFPMAAK